jgi:hypothetical protein
MYHYNSQRPHMGINGQIPQQQSLSQASGSIHKMPVLGGLHNHYFRKAA